MNEVIPLLLKDVILFGKKKFITCPYIQEQYLVVCIKRSDFKNFFCLDLSRFCISLFFFFKLLNILKLNIFIYMQNSSIADVKSLKRKKWQWPYITLKAACLEWDFIKFSKLCLCRIGRITQNKNSLYKSKQHRICYSDSSNRQKGM